MIGFEQALGDILKELPPVIGWALLAFLGIKEALKYFRSRDTIKGKTDIAKLQYETEVETTQRRTQDELFSLFRQMHQFDKERDEKDRLYQKENLEAQHKMIEAFNSLSEKMMLPEERIIQSILIKLTEIQVELVKYHDAKHRELSELIKSIKKD